MVSDGWGRSPAPSRTNDEMKERDRETLFVNRFCAPNRASPSMSSFRLLEIEGPVSNKFRNSYSGKPDMRPTRPTQNRHLSSLSTSCNQTPPKTGYLTRFLWAKPHLSGCPPGPRRFPVRMRMKSTSSQISVTARPTNVRVRINITAPVPGFPR